MRLRGTMCAMALLGRPTMLLAQLDPGANQESEKA